MKIRTTIMGIIAILIIVIAGLIINTAIKPKLSPEVIKENTCIDKDANADLTKQSLTSSYVMFMNNECGAWHNYSYECGAFLTVNDFCKNNTLLLEQTCDTNYLVTKELKCNFCLNGRCL